MLLVVYNILKSKNNDNLYYIGIHLKLWQLHEESVIIPDLDIL